MRLSGFDYSRPMFYMVTLKRLPGRQALSAVVEPGRCEMNATTRAFVNCIRTFHLGCAAIEPIECFTIMPDHVHHYCEKECGNAIFTAGGSLIALSPEGFPDRWHPTRNKEALCAEGRMLFLSLYEAQAAKLDNPTLYRRCHEMGDLAVAAVRAKLVGEPPHQPPPSPNR